MATLEQLLSAVQTQVSLVTTGLQMFDSNVAVMVGKYWPPVKTIQQNCKMKPPSALVSIYDHKLSHDSTRWIPNVTQLVVTTTKIVVSPGQMYLMPGQVGVFTYSGSTTPGDAVSLVTTTRFSMSQDPGDGTLTDTPSRAVVDVLAPSDGIFDISIDLANLVAEDSLGVGQWVSVVVSGNTLAVTNLLPTVLNVSSNAGNGGVMSTEIARRKRAIQIVVWAPSPEIRTLVCDPIEVLISQIETFRGLHGEFSAGLPLPDQQGARVLYMDDILFDDPILSDTYRRDLVFAVDYAITVQDQLFSVLAPITAYNFSY
jgi:hypothetical protein